MEYIIALFVFSLFYMIVYAGPFLILLLLVNDVFTGIIPAQVREPLVLIFGIISLYQFFVSQYRAKLATDCRVLSSMKFKHAHESSKAIFKTNLSYIPLIGMLYRTKEK